MTVEPGSSARLWRVVALVAIVTSVWSGLAIGARATYGSRTAADEPQYLLTALSLWDDQSLEITDELAAHRERPFHESTLPVQTASLDRSGRMVSPHDPLLPAVLAIPMGLGGWAAAKATLALLAGALAGLLVWTAVRRFGADPLRAGVTVAAFSLSAPLVAYGTQVYPELPAAFAVTVAVAALTGPLGLRGRVGIGLAVVTLPWLGVKYAPTAAVLAMVGAAVVWRAVGRKAALQLFAALLAAGAVFLVAHRAWYGGWTVYAAGDHFVSGGELSVVGVDPDYLGRTQRLSGLFVDRGFGLVAWAPVFLLAIPAFAALVRRRPAGWVALAAPLAAGWATATWVALTMHGWWWPGRQVVVVVPCLVLATAWWTSSVRTERPREVVTAHRTVGAGVLGTLGMAMWGWLVAEVLAGDRALIVDFESTSNPLYRAWRLVLPDHRVPTDVTPLLSALWLALLAALAWYGWRGARAPAPAAPDLSNDPSINRRYPHRVPV